MFLELTSHDNKGTEEEEATSMLLQGEEEEDDIDGTAISPAFRVERSMLQFENMNL